MARPIAFVVVAALVLCAPAQASRSVLQAAPAAAPADAAPAPANPLTSLLTVSVLTCSWFKAVGAAALVTAPANTRSPYSARRCLPPPDAYLAQLTNPF